MKLPKKRDIKDSVLSMVNRNIRKVDTIDEVTTIDVARMMGWGIDPEGNCYEVDLEGNFDKFVDFNAYLFCDDNKYLLQDYDIEWIFRKMEAKRGVYYDY